MRRLPGLFAVVLALMLAVVAAPTAAQTLCDGCRASYKIVDHTSPTNVVITTTDDFTSSYGECGQSKGYPPGCIQYFPCYFGGIVFRVRNNSTTTDVNVHNTDGTFITVNQSSASNVTIAGGASADCGAQLALLDIYTVAWIAGLPTDNVHLTTVYGLCSACIQYK